MARPGLLWLTRWKSNMFWMSALSRALLRPEPNMPSEPRTNFGTRLLSRIDLVGLFSA
ncbi:hypothetical protein D3C71_1931490 [compost metagenome]